MPKEVYLRLPEEKKKRVKEAIAEELSRVSLEDFSIRRVTKRAEIARGSFYQYFDGGIVQFAIPVPLALIAGGIIAAICAYLIGLPVLRLKSDYLAIATLGFAEIIRAVFQWDKLGPLTN